MSVAVPLSWRDRATLSVEQAATILGVGRSAAYQAAGTGDLPVIRLGRRVLVPVAQLRRMLGELQDDDPPGKRVEVTTEDHGAVPTSP